MRIVAVSTVLNEADVIEKTITHLLKHGVDTIAVAAGPSTDGTRELLAEFPIVIVHDDLPHHFQPHWINRLAHKCTEEGDWVLPFDADEYHYPVDGSTIRETLAFVPDGVNVLHVASHQQRDWDYRFTDEMGMGKIMFRYHPDAVVANGNHSVSGFENVTADDIVHLREVQFRSFEHMQAKCKERVEKLDPDLPYSEGTHQRVLAAMNPIELLDAWEARQARPVVYDPVPLLTERVGRIVNISGIATYRP